MPVWLAAGSDPGALLGALIPFDKHLPYRLASALRLWQSLQGRSMTAADMTSQRRRRLLLALRALDGRETGASYRQLAQGMFGVARVPAGAAWKSHDLRGRTMRLVAEGIRLRDGGYRGLLHLGPRIKLAH